MNEQERLDFVTALGEEFCTVLAPVVGSEMCPQDGYEVFAKVLGTDFGPDTLQLLSDFQLNQIRTFGCTWLECVNITDNDLREVVRRTLARW